MQELLSHPKNATDLNTAVVCCGDYNSVSHDHAGDRVAPPDAYREMTQHDDGSPQALFFESAYRCA